MPKVNYNNIEFDSKEEVDFYICLRDMQKFGIIKSFKYHPDSFILIPKHVVKIELTKVNKRTGKKTFKTKDKVIFREHKYTADFKVEINPEKFGKLNHKLLINKDGTFYVDTKGVYNRFGGDRAFTIHQKLLFDKTGIYVNKVNPIEFFQRIGYAPEELRYMKNRKVKTLRKRFDRLKPFEEFNKCCDNNEQLNQINANFLLF